MGLFSAIGEIFKALYKGSDYANDARSNETVTKDQYNYNPPRFRYNPPPYKSNHDDSIDDKL